MEKGEGNGGRERGAMKTRKRRSSRLQKIPLFTLIHSFPLVVHHTFHSVHPFHRFPEILEYRRSIFLKRVYQNDYENDERYCQANYDEHQFLRTKYRELPSLVDVTRRRTRETERAVERKLCIFFFHRAKKKGKKKHVSLAIEPYTTYPCVYYKLEERGKDRELAPSLFLFFFLSLSLPLSLSVCLSVSLSFERRCTDELVK